MNTEHLLLVVGVIFAAAFVRSALGFGDAVIAMPLLAMVVGLRTAAPLVAFMGPTISVLILTRGWRRVDVRPASRLVAASVLGIPIGVYGLARLPEEPLKVALGVVILLYGVFGLARPGARFKEEKAWVPWAVGWTAGVLGGAYNTNGPPVVAYGMLRGWPPERFRTTLQSYFLPTGLMILAGHGLAGLWTGEVLRLYGLSLPAIALGIVLGGRLNRKMSHEMFAKLVYGSLAAMGAVLLVKAIF
jgi:uncharacterized membrane protein YfcA